MNKFVKLIFSSFFSIFSISFFLILFGVLIGCFFKSSTEQVIDQFHFQVTFSGAMGGILFAIQNKSLELPRKNDNSTFYLGFISDMFVGISGAYVIFLILPFDLDSSQNIESIGNSKIIATAILGGYAGRSMLRAAYNKLSLESVQNELRTVQIQQKEIKFTQKKQEKYNSRALRLLDTQLSHTLEKVPEKELENAIRHSSAQIQEIIFYKTSGIRKEFDEKKRQLMGKCHCNHEDQEKIQNLSTRIERTVPVFRALTNSKYGQDKHRYFANLGYALKDQKTPEWKEAIEALKKAINLSIQQGEEPLPHYYFSKAICLVKIAEYQNEIININEVIEAIKKSSHFYTLRISMLEGLGNRLLSSWLNSNNLELQVKKEKAQEFIDVVKNRA